jgi:HlyD family secretion protein
MKKKTLIISLSGLALILILGFMVHSCKNKAQNISFETSKATKGTVSNTVTATGTIEALKTVEVGTQVSGVISNIYVDFNSVVKKGQILAEIDKTPLMAALQIAQASLDEAKANMVYQSSSFERIKTLHEKNLVAQSDYDLALYNYSQAQGSLKNSESNYNKASINLSYATITSPINGVVLNRAVDEGQTVAASFNTPTLFSIANDLTQMQVEVAIDEADIGHVKNGQHVDFTVDAFPDLNFIGEVTQIRLNPVITSNVVTYTVIVRSNNPDSKLMPGMTANISIIVQKAENALLVPYKATRFVPDNSMMALYYSSLSKDGKPENMKMPENMKAPKDGSFPGMMGAPQKTALNDSTANIWVKTDKILHPVTVKTGVSDGSSIEIKSGLKEGDEVILSMSLEGGSGMPTGSTGAKSPFMPTPPGAKKK